MIYTNHTSNYQNILNLSDTISYEKSSNLLIQQKILVPVHISRLYDYQVVCTGKDGIINRNDLISQLSKTCQIKVNGTLNMNLNPPDDFQIRSSSSLKYVKLWQVTNVCTLFQNETIAIIIPYRDREKNLQNLLYNLIPLLQRQSILNYKIFISEQQTLGAFNKGRLNNIAFHYIMKTYKPTCVIFHDADLIPENEQNLYTCITSTDHPIHMSANQFDQKVFLY
ncbi:unnamed protein product [Adineta steineri]|uniref:Galactosyltransferase N-terminal domain-containing protein n=1 Tax=Adineta steineri TaxID=433720 RepID=A0A814MH28_9BILA|nr:unnamed protein product [Adineta steineri]